MDVVVEQGGPPEPSREDRFRRWWPIFATTASFFIGAVLLGLDRAKGTSLGASEVVLYLVLMGQLPIALAGQFLGYKKS